MSQHSVLPTLHPVANVIVANVERVLLGKRDAVKLSLAALLAGGHVLIEDVPGVGKTILARALAISIGGEFKRIQFTPDLLPGDVTGVQIYNLETRAFEFRAGPVMTQVLLADEINRATPKTQSALLESMDERRFTVDSKTYVLPDPFIVLATQNPIEFEGTFPLPESQLDRFLISLRLGYPDRQNELAMLAEHERVQAPIDTLTPVASIPELLDLQQRVRSVYVDDSMRSYLLNIVEATRQHADIRLGASPRASIALFRMSQAWALIHGREYVLPDDLKAASTPVLRHRIVPALYDGDTTDRTIEVILHRIAIPGNRG